MLPILTCGVSPLWPLARCRGARTLARDGRHAAITARDASMQAVVACPLIGREIDVERAFDICSAGKASQTRICLRTCYSIAMGGGGHRPASTFVLPEMANRRPPLEAQCQRSWLEALSSC
eukprot:COSAG06_NODE_781_length_12364_cov_6.388912_7_plen_121_part_00